MPLKILFKYTSRSRKENYFRGLGSIVNNLANKEDYFILNSFDVDDKEMANEEVRDRLSQYKNVSTYYGISHSKISAINRDMAFAPEFDVIINFSDDQIITKYGFDDMIRYQMEQFFPDTDGVLHYPDTVTGDRLITMSIMGKKYFDRFGFIYDPSFYSVYADNQFGDISKILVKYVFISDNIYTHLHPAFNLAPTDEQYQRTEHPTIYDKDRNTYMVNKANNFGL